MRHKAGMAGAVLFFLVGVAMSIGAQALAPQAPQGGRGNAGGQGAAAAQGNRGRGQNLTNFPAQQRPPGDPAVVARGNTLYGMHCRSCHGPDLRGGDGGTNLLRSAVLLNDQAGELIIPVVRDGRNTPGIPPMPPMQLADADVVAIAEYLHSVTATARGQGAPPAGPPITLTVLVGNANAGRTYFDAKCASCHSTTGDLRGIGARVTNPTQLQNLWVGGGGRGGGANPVIATVTLPSGQKFEGQLGRIDNFIVILNFPDGTSRSFRRDGDTPKVDVRDPRQAHRNLLPSYTDKDIHDVTAYLVTLK